MAPAKKRTKRTTTPPSDEVPKKKPATKRKRAAKKSTTRGARNTAKKRAALSADSPEAWAREMRRTLFTLAESLRRDAEEGKMSPLEKVGAVRALTDAINDRDAILTPPEGDEL